MAVSWKSTFTSLVDYFPNCLFTHWFNYSRCFFNFTEHYLSAWIIAPACLFLCMPLVRVAAKLISKIIPKDETTAIHSDDLIGRTAKIILGEAKPNSPAQAKVKDQFGQMHYVLVEPELDVVFTQGQDVILTQRTKIGFQAISA